MRNTVPHARTCAVLLAGTALAAVPAAPAAAAPGQGYVRLAHLSPDTPAVDVYLYAEGAKNPKLVLRHVAYGALSPYQRLGGGRYTVAMRPADASAASKPVLSAHVRVRAGASYTVAGMGPYKGIRLDVLHDTATLPAGRTGLRVIAASLKHPDLKVAAGGRTLIPQVRFGTATPYRTLAPGKVAVKVAAPGARASTRVALAAGTVHTVIALDGAKGLRLLDLRDAAKAAGTAPRGGVDTGLGGTATAGSAAAAGASPWWLAAPALPFGLGLYALRRRRAS
ncbi:DUF4397 domain-containing protein [Actinomadura parmotrematis]|uniref:DUF4397 domain-containing protein n=1 Tax=Actinomadura parmotrematis TaxID=2864039 RepID=A0ABS7FN77_9ACTN|nr:DUF4397 domain-containing protein [Actinomadura parmotrematis]MBW8481848.1 DUF4397 domain-containing protein [Actinomadura parmotrematis]